MKFILSERYLKYLIKLRFEMAKIYIKSDSLESCFPWEVNKAKPILRRNSRNIYQNSAVYMTISQNKAEKYIRWEKTNSKNKQFYSLNVKTN